MSGNVFDQIQRRVTDSSQSPPAAMAGGPAEPAHAASVSCQRPRDERITALLANNAPWLIGEGRAQTRCALTELLGEMTDAEFAYVEDSRVLLQALPQGRRVNVTPYAILCRMTHGVAEQFEVRFELITLDAAIEIFPFGSLKALIRGALAYAFAKLDGFDDWQAVQIAESAKLSSSGRVD